MYKNNLLYLRKKLGLTQDDIAKVTNMTRGSYSHYETEDDILSLNSLNAICNYFNVSFDYMFEFTNIENYNNIKKEIDKKEVGKRLKEFRIENNLTQVKLADTLKTTHSTISAYESGKTLILTAFLFEICSKYRISADYILGKIDSPKYLDNN